MILKETYTLENGVQIPNWDSAHGLLRRMRRRRRCARP